MEVSKKVHYAIQFASVGAIIAIVVKVYPAFLMTLDILLRLLKDNIDLAKPEFLLLTLCISLWLQVKLLDVGANIFINVSNKFEKKEE